MDKFLEVYNLPRLNHKEMKNPNRLINNKEIETIIKNLSKSKSPVPDRSSSESYQTSEFILRISVP